MCDVCVYIFYAQKFLDVRVSVSVYVRDDFPLSCVCVLSLLGCVHDLHIQTHRHTKDMTRCTQKFFDLYCIDPYTQFHSLKHHIISHVVLVDLCVVDGRDRHRGCDLRRDDGV